MKLNHRICRAGVVLLLVAFVLTGAGLCQAGADISVDPEKVEAQKLGDHIWGPRITQADLMGKVIACFPYSGTDRTAGSMPAMAAKVRSRNMIVFMVLVDNEELPMALRLASAGKLKNTIVGITQDKLKKLLPGLNLEAPKAQGRGRRGGGRGGKQGSYATMAVVRTPDGETAFSGQAERQKTKEIMAAIAGAAAKFPVPVAVSGDFSEVASTVRKLAGSGNYGSVVKELTKAAEGDKAEKAEQAQALLDNIKAYGMAYLEKGAYYEEHYPAAAQETYTWVAKYFKGHPVGDAAAAKLKALKGQKGFRDELAACKLADAIRGQCAMLMSPKPDAQADLTDADYLKFNKKTAGGLMRNVGLFKKKYMETKAAAEVTRLLSTYSLTL